MATPFIIQHIFMTIQCLHCQMDLHIPDRISVGLYLFPVPIHIYHICTVVLLLVFCRHSSDRTYQYSLYRMNKSSCHRLQVLDCHILDRTYQLLLHHSCISSRLLPVVLVSCCRILDRTCQLLLHHSCISSHLLPVPLGLPAAVPSVAAVPCYRTAGLR